MNNIFRLIVILSLLSVAACNDNIPGDSINEKVTGGKKAAEFRLKKLGENDSWISLSDYIGKPVFLDFWASWCPPCRMATPYVEQLSNDFSGTLEVVGVNLDSNISQAMDYISKESIKYPQVTGTGTSVSGQYGVRGIPAFFIIDAEGNIIKSYTGFAPAYYDEWVNIISGMIEK